MHKFMVVKKSSRELEQDASSSQKSSSEEMPVIKMCGYLKKKRNRVGGWQKLWFILQNQLLLSYKSREDYEKKLAPFRDVLNLVPGTVIRPSSRIRFTIESTSNIIYTFRCNDTKECSQWISSIVDSLNQQHSTNARGSLALFSTSMEKCSRLPKLPIIKNTARILKYRDFDDETYSDDEENEETEITEYVNAVIQDSGLCEGRHPERGNSVNQYLEYHRSGKMFSCTMSASACGVSLLRNYHHTEEKIDEDILEEGDEAENKQEDYDTEEQTLCISLDDKISLACDDESEIFHEEKPLKIDEPIYAAVDLKDKYARRAKLKEEQERGKSISSDYEEIVNLPTLPENRDKIQKISESDEEDNIYEPIEIASDMSYDSREGRNGMWKYFSSRINMDNFTDFTRRHRRREDSAPEPATPFVSSLAEIRKKWGSHRSSIKNRMKRIYSRRMTKSMPEVGGKSQNEERKLFRSLSRFKFPRASSLLDDLASRRRLVEEPSAVGAKEETGQVDKFPNGKVVCHSTFYY
ncbi:differentially expressed in FDCP 6 homolog isoform X2 [Phlebotomus papatasi]|uniref:differentially expressed in FDCP 6 homolog isoform X2 n=1 Tax=Phlebotomus papatasi TaxID=29031 RepID=UPI002483FEB5|nr:differentially expressed in FDCP 6 homolog isoform X2 [Phlebotomus papatasi]